MTVAFSSLMLAESDALIWSVMADGRRVLGDNKTWIGFFSMIFFCTIFQVVFGFFCNRTNLNAHCDLYSIHENTVGLNLLFGSLMGVIYMLSELPNSFIKRRAGIPDGRTVPGWRGLFFFIFDQIDSLIGVMLLLYLVSDITLNKYLLYVLLGGLTHLIINLLLYWLKVRKHL